MNEIPDLFIAVVVLAGCLATVSIWSPRRVTAKFSAVLTTLLFLPVAYAAFVELLSKPKPIDMEWWLSQSEEATVLGSRMQEGEGIYLWLQLKDSMEPRSYVLPWNRELAEQLQEALQEADRTQSGVAMRLPFEQTYDNREPKFYAVPQPVLPMKEGGDDEGPMMYEPPSTPT